MGSLSKKAIQCQQCRFRETCEHKKWYLELAVPLSQPLAQPIMQPLLIDDRDVMRKEIEKAINKELYKKVGLMYGA